MAEPCARKPEEYNFFKDEELSHEDKQENIYSIVREIQIFGMKSRFSAFK
jgi:hypothetical protein